jgi:hypothetical protein
MTPGPLIAAGAHAPLAPHDYSSTCWWCGGVADSREHRHKASDLRREFGRPEYEAGDVIISRSEDHPEVLLPGPNSKVAKFSNNFCARCNNERSQPFDRAYDTFIEWFLANEEAVERTGVVPLDEIFDDYTIGSFNVLRYFGKHIGCRIADNGFTVPGTLHSFLDRGEEPAGFVFSFEINEDLAGVTATMRQNPQNGTGFLALGPVAAQITRSNGYADELTSWWSYHGLQVNWEWKTEYPRSWTNLLGPVAEFPVGDPVHSPEGASSRD